ncbi:MAG: TPM domain-containing protein [Chitinophagaceae bacterium]
MKNLFAFIFLLISFCVQAQIDKVIPARPNPPKLVNDYAEKLTPEQEHALEAKLVAYNDSTSSQITVVTIGSLKGYDIAEYGLALGRKWGVGGKQYNNGVIVLVSLEDRLARIEVGPGLEGAIPDITAKSIIDNAIVPNFRSENYYRGLDQATDLVIKAAAGEYKAPQGYGKKSSGKGIGAGAIIFILALIFLFSGRGGGRGKGGMMSRRGYRDVGAAWIIGSLLGGSGRGGGGFSGGGGGGFGGFGGGSFGGGGASGSW